MSASRNEADYVWENALAEDARAPGVRLLGDDQEHQRYVEAMGKVPYETAVLRFTALLQRGANISEQWHEMAGYLDAHAGQYARRFESTDARILRVGDGFPRMTRWTVPPGVTRASYDIDLEQAQGLSASFAEALKELKAL